MQNARIVKKFVLDQPHSLKKKDRKKMTPLHLSCWKGHFEVVQVVYTKEICEAQDSEGNTPLHLACRSGTKNIVLFLIKNQVNLSPKNHLNEAPIHIAAQIGCVDIAKLLLGKGVPIELQDACQLTPLHHAAKCGKEEMLEFLITRYEIMPMHPIWKLCYYCFLHALIVGHDMHWFY